MLRLWIKCLPRGESSAGTRWGRFEPSSHLCQFPQGSVRPQRERRLVCSSMPSALKPVAMMIGLRLLALVAGVFFLAVWPSGSAQASMIDGGGDRGGASVPGLQPREVEAITPRPFGYGITVDLVDQPLTQLMNGVAGMHLNWVRQPVHWGQVEPAPGLYDWSQLDSIVDSVHVRGLGLLAVIVGTPEWARPAGFNEAHDGPPADPNTLGGFLAVLSSRYAGRIDAYQIWQDPNIIANWDSAAGPSAEDYVRLLSVAYLAIKAGSPDAQVISAGLDPTAAADGLAAVDDLEYLSIMYQAGFSAWCNVVGVHLNGTSHPPSDYVDEAGHTSSAFESESSFFFRHYEAVRRVMIAYGDEETPVWLTQVGWASLSPAPTGYAYAADVTEEQQADYLIQAFRMAEQVPYIHAMMVDNFNLSTISPSSPAAGFSLIRSDWTARPALLRLAQMRQEQILSSAGASYSSARNRAPQSGVKPYLRHSSPEVTLRE